MWLIALTWSTGISDLIILTRIYYTLMTVLFLDNSSQLGHFFLMTRAFEVYFLNMQHHNNYSYRAVHAPLTHFSFIESFCLFIPFSVELTPPSSAAGHHQSFLCAQFIVFCLISSLDFHVWMKIFFSYRDYLHWAEWFPEPTMLIQTSTFFHLWLRDILPNSRI